MNQLRRRICTTSIDIVIGERRQQIKSEMNGSAAYDRDVAHQAGDSNAPPRGNALPTEISTDVISVQSDSGGELEIRAGSSIIKAGGIGTSSGAQTDAIYLSDSPPQHEFLKTAINEEHNYVSVLRANAIKEEYSTPRSNGTQHRKNSKPIILVADTDTIVPQFVTNPYCGSDIDDQLSGQNPQVTAVETYLQTIRHDHNTVPSNVQLTISAHTTAAGYSTESTVAPFRSTVISDRTTDDSSTPIIIESPPIAHVRQTGGNQYTSSDIETAPSSMGASIENAVGSDQESAQLDASQVKPRFVTVNADVLNYIMKIVASDCEHLIPDGENAQQHERNLYHLLTSTGQSQAELNMTLLLNASLSTQSSTGSYESHSSISRRECNNTGISDDTENEVMCIGDNSPLHSSQQSIRQEACKSIVVPSDPEDETRTPIRTKSRSNQQVPVLISTPTTSDMEQSISLTSKNSWSMHDESTFESTLMEGVLDDSFSDECTTPVQIRPPFIRIPLGGVLECSEPARKRAKLTLDKNQETQLSHHREERFFNEAVGSTSMIDDNHETLLTNAAQSEPSISSEINTPSLTAESANIGGMVTNNPPNFISLVSEESPDITMPQGIQRYTSLDDSSSIPSTQTAMSSCTDQDVSSDSSVSHERSERPKPKRRKRKRCGKCANCLIPDCNNCNYCLYKQRYHRPCKNRKPCLTWSEGQQQSSSNEAPVNHPPSLREFRLLPTLSQTTTEPAEDFLDKALKDSYVEICAAKCGVFGPPGTGKSHFKALVSGRKRPGGGRQSTAIADEADQMIPVVDIGLGYDDDMFEMHRMVSQSQDGSNIKWYITDSRKFESLVAKTLYKQKKPNALIIICERQTSSKTLRSRVLNHLKILIQKNPKGSKLKCLTGIRLIYIVDTGGQPQFQEIMPMFVRSSSVHFLMHKLNQPLDECPQFDYEINGIKYTVPEEMLVSNRTYIEQSLRTISSCVFARNSEQYTGASIPRPQFAIVGMFKDKCNDRAVLDKKRKDVNDCIQPYVDSRKCEAITPSRHNDKPVFSVDGSEEGWCSNGNVIDDLHTNIENFTVNLKIKVPLRWFLFLNLLKEQSKCRPFITLQECKDLAKKEGIMMNDEKDIVEALKLLDELNLVLYFHKILPNVVFISPAFLLNKVSEIIVQSFDCSTPNTGISSEERHRFRMTGIFEKSMLQKVKYLQNGFNKSFSQDDLLELLKQLCIIADIEGSQRFFIPCVLALELINDDINSQFLQSIIDRMHTTEVEPLIISFPDGYSPRGLFCASIAFLAKLPNWAIESSSNVSLTRKRNLVEFEISECTQHGQTAISVVPLGNVVIVDRMSHIEIYSTCDREFLRGIRCSINQALWYAASKCLAYSPENIKLCIGFSCKIDCGKPKPHGTAVQARDDSSWWMKCTRNLNKRAVRLNNKQLPWYAMDTSHSNSAVQADSKPNLALLMDEVATKTNKWQMIALHLEFEQVYVERIERQERGDIEACFHAVFARWQKQSRPPFTWSVIIDALSSPSVYEVALADDLKKKYLAR